MKPSLGLGIACAAAALGAGLAAALGTQAPGDLDVERIRDRARLVPEDAARLEQEVARRGDSFKADALRVAKGARDSQDRLAPTDGTASSVFDFDAMIAAARPAAPADLPRLVAFVSLSMPDAALRQVIADVIRAGGVVAFRGFPANSAKVFVAALARIVPKDPSSTNIGIDPRLFRAFNITTVPTYVVTAAGFDLCDGFDCATRVPPHDILSGNVTLRYALETMKHGGGPAAQIAGFYGRQLDRGSR